MTARMWSATLNSSSPRYLDWKGILEWENVPLVDANPRQAEPIGEHYLLDVDQLTEDQKFRLISWVSKKFEAPASDVWAEIKKSHGYPIRAADVIVAFSMRSFM